MRKWRRSSEFIARNLEEVGQARSAANVRTKAQAEAMRKRSGFDENTPDYYFKVGDMVKMKHMIVLNLSLNGKGPVRPSLLMLYHTCSSIRKAHHSKDGEVSRRSFCPYQIFGEGKHHPPERPGVTAIANRAILECATSANPPPTPREPKVVFPDKFDGSRRHLRGFLNQLELIFRIQPLTYSSEQLRIATVGTLIRKSAHLVHPNGRVPRWPPTFFRLGKASKGHDQHLWNCRSNSSPSPRFVFWVKAPNHALRTLPHSAS
ncbi:hypothetical protein BASA83_013410 [Batrachochytrium salamandrivorans]|nr:hypothetical protein BASA83_013410 [Batrachochytrium salamandrivorans]